MCFVVPVAPPVFCGPFQLSSAQLSSVQLSSGQLARHLVPSKQDGGFEHDGPCFLSSTIKIIFHPLLVRTLPVSPLPSALSVTSEFFARLSGPPLARSVSQSVDRRIGLPFARGCFEPFIPGQPGRQIALLIAVEAPSICSVSVLRRIVLSARMTAVESSKNASPLHRISLF